MESLAELRVQRRLQCRLAPDRALRSLEEADAFLRDRGLLTRTADCALPSLYEACHEDPYKPGSAGFATWPATKWPWFGELAERGYLVTAVHRGKNLLVSGEVACLLDPICRAEIKRMRAADRGWRRLPSCGGEIVRRGLAGRWFSEHVTNRRRITWDAYFLYGPEARWDQELGPLVSRSSASSVIADASQPQVAVQPLLEGRPSPLVYARLRAWWQLHR